MKKKQAKQFISLCVAAVLMLALGAPLLGLKAQMRAKLTFPHAL